MSNTRHIDPFFIVLRDEDKKVFTVVGPMTDDTLLNKRVSTAQEQKRNVKLCNYNHATSLQQVIDEEQRYSGAGWCYVDEDFI